MRAERKKVWQEWGLESPFLILRLVHGERNIMVLVVPSWDDARWLCQDSSWEHLPASYCPVVITVHFSKAAFSVIPDHVHFYISTFVLFPTPVNFPNPISGILICSITSVTVYMGVFYCGALTALFLRSRMFKMWLKSLLTSWSHILYFSFEVQLYMWLISHDLPTIDSYSIV